MRVVLVSLLAALVIVLNATIAPVSAQSAKPELRKLDIAGHPRVYTVERIGSADATRPRAILMELHGSGTDVRDHGKNRFLPNFSVVPDLPPLLLVRPQGANRVWDAIPTGVNDWRRLSGTDGVQVDDLVFLRAVIADVVAKDGGDAARVAAYGISSGGFMVSRLACEMSDAFRALANLIATTRGAQLTLCEGGQPRPYMFLASKDDPTIPYNGLDQDGKRFLASADETLALFAKRNGCGAPEETAVPHIEEADPTRVTLVRYKDCKSGADLVHYRLDGAGHNLPSRVRYENDRDTHKINRDLETSQELWNFFKRYL